MPVENIIENVAFDQLSELLGFLRSLHVVFVQSIENAGTVDVNVLAQTVVLGGVRCVNHRVRGKLFLNNTLHTCWLYIYLKAEK